MTGNIGNQMFSYASSIIEKVADRYGEGRMGGSLCGYNKDGQLVRQQMIGKPSLEKSAKYERFAREKAERLIKNPDHITSWQSRNPTNDMYGGAIRLPSGMILSFSGFLEAVDTAFNLLLLYTYQVAPNDYLLAVADAAECRDLYIEMVTALTPKMRPDQ